MLCLNGGGNAVSSLTVGDASGVMYLSSYQRLGVVREAAAVTMQSSCQRREITCQGLAAYKCEPFVPAKEKQPMSIRSYLAGP